MAVHDSRGGRRPGRGGRSRRGGTAIRSRGDEALSGRGGRAPKGGPAGGPNDGAVLVDAPRPPKPPVRLTRRGRAVLVMGMALLSLGGFWLGTRAASHASAEAVTPAGARLPWVEVHKGDTIWTIADAMAGPGDDPAVVATEIQRLNGLSGSLVRTGARLYVPPGLATP